VLSRPGRLQLLELLTEQELTLEDCAVGLAPGGDRISAQLADLIDCGCVSESRAGRTHRYRADPRAREVVNLVRAFVADCSPPLNVCQYIQDEIRPDEINHSSGEPGMNGRPQKRR
jgi:hypothetical protein